MANRQSMSELNRTNFDDEASEYDKSIFNKSHSFQGLQGMVLTLIGASPPAEGRVLELGVGTGSLTALILDQFPSLELDGYDISDKMLEVAREKLRPYRDRVQIYQRDITVDIPAGQYDVAVTVNTIHHINHRDKPRLIYRLYPLLKPGGRLILGDRFSPGTDELAEMYEDLRKREFEAQGFDQESIEEEFSPEHHTGSSLATIDEYITWMRKTGFSKVDIVWKHLGSAILYGERPPSTS